MAWIPLGDRYLDLLRDDLTRPVDGDDPKEVIEGRAWPKEALTMVGRPRLDNLREVIKQIVQWKVPGDLIELGVWRGGASIFMRACLFVHDDKTRDVWVADSFEGLPPPDPSYILDQGDDHHTKDDLKVSLEEVQENFRKYNLLDNQVQFLRGYFKDSLPKAPIERLSLIRLDADMYGSTWEALVHLYPKLSVSGYVIVDDYAIWGAHFAVNDYLEAIGEFVQLVKVDHSCWYWQKTKTTEVPAEGLLPRSSLPTTRW